MYALKQLILENNTYFQTKSPNPDFAPQSLKTYKIQKIIKYEHWEFKLK